MSDAIFELDHYGQLPLWAQVLMAARVVRRALKELPSEEANAVRLMDAACDAAAQSAAAGSIPRSVERTLRSGIDFTPTSRTASLWSAMYFLIDATVAAQASETFSAADVACTSSVGHVFKQLSESPGMSPVRVRTFIAGDLDLLRFACSELRIGTYDRIPNDVMRRLTPA